MSIHPDRLREIADGAMGIGAPLVLTQAEQVEVCTELLALREQNARLVADMVGLGQERSDANAERDAARAEAEKLRDQLDRLLRAVRGAGCSSTMARLADEIEESDDRPIPCETCDATGKIDQRLGGYAWSGVVKCPDCDGDGEWTPTAQPIKAAARAEAEELRGNCRRCGYGKREHQAPDGGGCAGDFADQLPKGPAHGRFTDAERAELDALKRKAFEAAKSDVQP